MDTALSNAIELGGLRAQQQITLPRNASPRLSTVKLPVVDPIGIEFISALLHCRSQSQKFAIHRATDTNPARLLATDNYRSGVACRRANGSGVSKAFPLAMHVHTNAPSDIKPHHINGQNQIVLNSVMNSGKKGVEFSRTIRNLNPKVRIVVTIGVVQTQCVSPESMAHRTLSQLGNINLVALRLSDTKFTGSGTTDTGNRLFSSTHLHQH